MKAIEVEKVSFTYPDGRKALQEVSFSVKEGETFAIIGPNGAGKTTLLLALAGLAQVEGEVKISGQSRPGFLFQDPDDQLFMPTVYEDVAFGPLNLRFSKEEIPGIVKEALEAVGLRGFEERAPHHLSLGEKKRVSLATVLAMKPEVLLLDEPTSNLDPRSRNEFIKLLQSIEGTKVIAGHDLGMIGEISRRALLLNGGEKIAEGETLTILKNRELLHLAGLY